MSGAGQKSRILIADDNGPNVELLEAYLSGLDCEIGIAIDGRDTLAKVESFKPDLILLDVMMPKLSGFEVCEKLKSDPATRGMGTSEMKRIAGWMFTALKAPDDAGLHTRIRGEIFDLCQQFPVPAARLAEVDIDGP